MDDKELLLAEYKHFSDSFWKSEEVGEKRINFFISITTAIVAAVVAFLPLKDAALSEMTDQVRQIASFALAGAILLGFVTYLRMLQRNKVTDEYKKIVRYIREQLRRRSTTLHHYRLPFRASQKRLLHGGLAEAVALINSFLLAAIAALWFGKSCGWLLVLFVFVAALIPQVVVAGKRRQTGKPAAESETTMKPPAEYFRAGVGAVLLDKSTRVLALERKEIPGAWQFPQGGLEAGEDPLDAVKREIFEETGIKEYQLELLSPQSRLLAYELPAEYQSEKTGRGQVQHWFLFRYQGPDEAITLGDGREFKRWKWVTMEDLIPDVVPFRKRLYRELADEIANLTKKPSA